MDIAIPHGQIVDSPNLAMARNDWSWLHIVHDLGSAYEALAGLMGGAAEPVEARLLVDGQPMHCSYRTMGLNGRSVVITLSLPDAGTCGYVYVCEGVPQRPWRVATKMLVLPTEDAAVWSGDGDDSDDVRAEKAFQRVNGCIALYVGAVLVNNWLA